MNTSALPRTAGKLVEISMLDRARLCGTWCWCCSPEFGIPGSPATTAALQCSQCCKLLSAVNTILWTLSLYCLNYKRWRWRAFKVLSIRVIWDATLVWSDFQIWQLTIVWLYGSKINIFVSHSQKWIKYCDGVLYTEVLIIVCRKIMQTSAIIYQVRNKTILKLHFNPLAN